MVLRSIIGMRTGYAPTAPALVTCGLPPSIRQRSVEVPPASSATTSGKPATSATTALASAPAARPEHPAGAPPPPPAPPAPPAPPRRRTRQRGRDRLAEHLIGARNAAARLH